MAGSRRHIVGFSPSESRRVLELFFEQIAKPEYTVRFRWTPGSVAFLDNRSTSHLGPTDVPSRSLEGDAFLTA